jgi:DNA-binding Lrp family transcriptional regulator
MNRTLDRIDFAILVALQNDARRSNKELAAHVGLAPSSCLARVRQLRAAGHLLGAHAVVAPAVLGIELQALIRVRMALHTRQAVARFQEHLEGQPEVVDVFHVGGRHDFVIRVAVRDASHLRDLVVDGFTSRPEVAQVETSLVFEHRSKGVLPCYRTGD